MDHGELYATSGKPFPLASRPGAGLIQGKTPDANGPES